MAWPNLAQLISPITGVINKFQDGKQKKDEIANAQHLKKLEGIQNSDAAEFQADAKRVDNLSTSWKDEYITLVISLPLILCFLGEKYASVVAEGFKALALTPDWYQYMVVSVFLVGAGVPLAGKTVKTIKSILDKS